MGSFADIGLTYIFSVALGGLIALTFVAAFARLFWKNRKLAQNQRKQDLERAEKATQKTVMQETVLGEGDYFGVRAIERGYYGGVVQSPPASAGNSPQQSPAPTVRDKNGPPILPPVGWGPNVPDLISPGSSVSRAPSKAGSIKMPTSPITLRLQPSNAELTGRRNHDSSIVGNTNMPKSLSGAVSAADVRPVSTNVSRAHMSPNVRPVLNRRVQSYAEWRLAADMKRTRHIIPKAEVKFPELAYQDGSTNTSLIHPPSSRSTNRSVSTADGTSLVSSLQQTSDEKRQAHSFDTVNRPAPTACKGSLGMTRGSAGDHALPQGPECEMNHSLPVATIRSSHTRNNLQRSKKVVMKTAALEQRSRKNSKPHHGLTTHHRSDSGCDIDITLSPPILGDKCSGRARSSSSSRSSSSTKSPRSSNDSSASSVKSKIETLGNKSEPGHPIGLAISNN